VKENELKGVFYDMTHMYIRQKAGMI